MWLAGAEMACANALTSGLKAAPLVALSLALVGCAGAGRGGSQWGGREPASESALYLDAVRELIAQEQYYAAVAHIQEDRRRYGDTPELRLIEADARRKLQQGKTSEALYQSVLRGAPQGPLAGKARHGLGLLYATANLDAALRELHEAARLRPTDAAIRSDYGYALMQQGRFSEAQMQLATAHELAPDLVAARNNLLILLYAQGQSAAAARMAAAAQVDPSLLAELKSQAQSLKAARRKKSTGG